MFLHRACLCALSHLTLTTTLWGRYWYYSNLGDPAKHLSRKLRWWDAKQGFGPKVSWGPATLNHLPLHQTFCLGESFKAEIQHQEHSCLFTNWGYYWICWWCPDRVCLLKLKQCITCWPRPFDWNNLPLVKIAKSLWLNYNKSLLVHQGNFLSPPFPNLFLVKICPTSLQGHRPLMITQSSGKVDVLFKMLWKAGKVRQQQIHILREGSPNPDVGKRQKPALCPFLSHTGGKKKK